MACTLTALSSSTDCTANQGGINFSFACKFADITSVTVTSGVITGFTMASTGLWKRLDCDINNTSQYGQVATLNGNRATVAQSAELHFRGISAAYLAAANGAMDCCDTVFCHFGANGLTHVQGIEVLAATGAPVKTAVKSTRIIPSVLTDVSQNEARVEYKIEGGSNTFSMSTSLSATAIAAL